MIEAEVLKYSPDYFTARHYGHDAKRETMYQQERARAQAYLPAGRIFDCGCGVGDFLAGFDPAQYERHGIDISPYAVEQARSKGIYAVDYAENLPYQDESFDGVILRGTFQHFWNPFHTLRECARIIKSGGYMIFLATPNTRSLVYFLWGDLPALDAPRNWFVVSDKTLANIVSNLGFEVVRTVYPYLGTPYANPIRDMWHFIQRLCGLKVNFAFPHSMMEVYARKRQFDK